MNENNDNNKQKCAPRCDQFPATPWVMHITAFCSCNDALGWKEPECRPQECGWSDLLNCAVNTEKFFRLHSFLRAEKCKCKKIGVTGLVGIQTEISVGIYCGDISSVAKLKTSQLTICICVLLPFFFLCFYLLNYTKGHQSKPLMEMKCPVFSNKWIIILKKAIIGFMQSLELCCVSYFSKTLLFIVL